MSEWLGTIRFESLTYFFKAVTLLGSSDLLYLFLPILYWCWKKRAGFRLIVLVIITAYISYMLKGLFAWERPPAGLWLVSVNGYTFPSTHASIAVAMWGFLAYEMKKVWFTVIAIVLMVLISISRIYLGVHYLEDVLAGAALGAGLLHLYKWGFRWFQMFLSKYNDLIIGVAIVVISIALIFTQPNILVASGMGLLAGIGVGHLLEPHLADFDSVGTWPQHIIKIALGLLIFLTLWQGFEWVFPKDIGFKWFASFILGNWIVAGAPWLFVQLKLSDRES